MHQPMHPQQKRNTFYIGSQQQGTHQQDQKNVQQTKQLIWSSKKLIKQIQNNKNLKSAKSITSNNSINRSQANRLSAKNKIQNSIRNIKNNSTIAQQLLYNEDNLLQNNKKQDYMNIIQNVYSKNRRKKRKIKQQYPSQQIKSKKKRISYIPLSMNVQLHKQIVHRVGVMGSKNYINQQDSQQQNKKNKKNKQLNRLYNQQIQQVHNRIQSNSSIPTNTNIKTNKNNKNNNQQDISIIVGSNSHIQGKKVKLYNISSSQQLSSQEQNTRSGTINKNINQQDEQYFRKLQQQIDKDIDNIKISSNSKIQYKTNVPSSSQSQDKPQYSNINKKGQVISFRQQYSPKFNTFQIPTEQPPEDRIKQHTYHNDYGIDISQNKIFQLLNTIQRRIKYSSVVIDEVYYEHPVRQDNNQLQIDNRYHKETKQRIQLINKINNYVIQNNKYKRYYNINYSNKYRSRNINNSVLQHRYLFKFDPNGNKKMYYDNRLWRSPGVSPCRDKFISLNSPLRDNQTWYQQTHNQIKFINVDTKQRQLLLCRSAQTFATLTLTNKNKKIKNKIEKRERLNRSYSQSSSNYSQSDHYPFKKSKSKYKNRLFLSLLKKRHSQKAIRYDQWDRVKQIRKKIYQNQQF